MKQLIEFLFPMRTHLQVELIIQRNDFLERLREKDARIAALECNGNALNSKLVAELGRNAALESNIAEYQQIGVAYQQTVAELQGQVGELESLFDLQQTRMGEATALWREHHPGNELVLPDLGNLLSWLLARIRKERQ